MQLAGTRKGLPIRLGSLRTILKVFRKPVFEIIVRKLLQQDRRQTHRHLGMAVEMTAFVNG